MEQTITTQTKLKETDTQEKAVVTDPKILIIGYSEAGKTTASKLLAKQNNTECMGTAQVIMREIWVDCFQFSAKTPSELGEQASFIKKLKLAERFGDLFRIYMRDVGNRLRSDDPAALAKACLELDFPIVEGVRTCEEFNACKHLFDEILWIDRELATPNETDELVPSDADKIIDNNGTIDELRENLLNRNV